MKRVASRILANFLLIGRLTSPILPRHKSHGTPGESISGC